MMQRILLSITAVLFVCLSANAGEPEPFQSLSLEQALAKAKAEKKFVFVDFYATWCVPCKMHDQTTFKDPQVVAWLSKQAVALKIDAEKKEKTATKYRVESYPTLLYLKADGTEIERIVGYVNNEEFMMIAKSVEQGKTTLMRITESLKADPTNPMLHLEMARILGIKERYPESLKEYLWCLDEGAKHDPSFVEFRNNLLLMELGAFADFFNPVLGEMETRRASLEKLVSKGEIPDDDFGMYVGLGRLLGDDEHTIEAYRGLAKSVAPDRRKKLMIPVFDILLDAKSYEDIAGSVNILSEVDLTIAMARKELSQSDPELEKTIKDLAPAERAELERARKQGLIVETFGYYQALAGLGRAVEAETVAKRILAYDDSADTYNALAWSGYLTGRPSAKSLEYASKAYDLSHGASSAITDTLARVLHLRGDKAAAVSLVEKAIEKADNPRDTYILESCLADLKRS